MSYNREESLYSYRNERFSERGRSRTLRGPVSLERRRERSRSPALRRDRERSRSPTLRRDRERSRSSTLRRDRERERRRERSVSEDYRDVRRDIRNKKNESREIRNQGDVY